jgi:hypothetical protein
MKKQTNNNPFNNFLFSVPGKHIKMTYNELESKKNKIKEVEVIDLCSKKKIGRMSACVALLKFS